MPPPARWQAPPSSGLVRKWESNKQKWQDAHPIDPKRPHLGSWLDATVTGGLWGIGCKVCNESKGASTAFARFEIRSLNGMQSQNFRNHALSKVHIQAVATVLGENPEQDIAAPAATEFMQVIEATRKGRNDLPGTCGRHKMRRMKWCAAEAMRRRNRRIFTKAASMSIHQDVRQGRLAIRFQAADRDLNHYKGLLGTVNLSKDFDLSAKGIRDGTIFAVPSSLSAGVLSVNFVSNASAFCLRVHRVMSCLRRGGPAPAVTKR